MFPIVQKRDFRANLGPTNQGRAASPKLVIKGLTLLDGALDLDGSYVPGKSTLVVMHNDADTLKFLAAIVNSKIASFYVKQKYASASYNGGVSFTPDMLNSIPIPEKLDKSATVQNVNRIIAALEKIAAATAVVHSAIRASCGSKGLGRKLDKWFALTRGDFVAEVQKRGVAMTLRGRAEWADLFDEQTASIAQSLATLATAERNMDNTLYTAFGLNADERTKMASI